MKLFSEFKKFLTNLKLEWETKQQNVECRFVELSSMSDQLRKTSEEPKRKRKKRNVQPVKTIKQQLEDPYATFAAELQIEFFKKVIFNPRRFLNKKLLQY